MSKKRLDHDGDYHNKHMNSQTDGTNGFDIRPATGGDTHANTKKSDGGERPRKSHRDQVRNAKDFVGRNTETMESWVGPTSRN